MKVLKILSGVVASIALSCSFAFAQSPGLVLNFCPDSKGEIQNVETDSDAGVRFSSSILVPVSTIAVPSTGVPVGVYVQNLGPGPITYVFEDSKGLGSWSVWGNGLATAFRGTTFGQDLGKAVFTAVPLTPKGASAEFSDGSWGGNQDQNVELTGCTSFKEFMLPKGRATSHLDLSFLRGTELHTVRVNFQFK